MRPERAISIAIRWVLIFIGIQSGLHFIVFWLDPVHPKQMAFYIPLTIAMFWPLYEACVAWFYYLNIQSTPVRKPSRPYTVDVLTTAAPGEPLEMFERSLSAMQAITYPHRTWLLDGTGDPRFKRLAEDLGTGWIDCVDVPGAKAGKVNRGLAQTSGEIVLVLDPDHVAEPVFLDAVIGQFDDPDVGFVQVVQAYFNQNRSFVAAAAAEQTYGFYGPILMGMDGYNATIVIGANCTFRRAALESIGGHAVHLAEDLVTSIRLHAHGWSSRYIPKIVARGLVPEDLASFFSQQRKWSVGMFTVLFSILPRNLFRLCGWQRLTYLLTGSYYLVGIAMTINLVLPILFLFFGLWAVEMRFDDFLIHLVPFVVMFLIIHVVSQVWMRHSSERGLQWRGMLLKVASWSVFLQGFFQAVLGVTVEYTPTPKNRTSGGSVRHVAPHLAIIGLSAAAIIYGASSEQSTFEGTHLMMFFAGLNILLMLPAPLIAFKEWFTRAEAS